MEYFISDFHFQHTRMAKMRGFYSMEEMNETIIQKYNASVKQNDITYFLGDFCFRGEPQKFLDRLNGHFYFIRGNHDQKIIKHKKIIYWTNGYYDLKLYEQKLTLCHYPMMTWNCSHYNSWSLHGHHHSNIISEKFPGKRLCVSWESLNGYPISFPTIIEEMKKLPNNWDFLGDGNEQQESSSPPGF
jgi:calcineurin-like phosphoesterase family protein